jgi:WsaF, C-terminal domain/WsaF, N-terminal domain/Glycosyl transferase family 2
VRSLKLSLGGRAVAATAFAMPRRDGPVDLYGSAEEAAAGGPARSRAAELSGFWAIVPVPASDGSRRVVLEAVAELEDGGTAAAPLAEVELEPGGASGSAPPPAAAGQPLVAICMTTLDPSPQLFAAQLETIRAQTHANWTLLISDDGSRPEPLERLKAIAAADERIALRAGGGRRGAYRGFERALEMVPADASYVAFADQHGRWAPGKLAALLTELEGGAQLAYSDLRIVDAEGAVLREPAGADPPPEPVATLLHSPVSGAAAAFRRELLSYALPFPQPLGPRARHEDWVAAVASALGPLARVRSCLHDHVPSFAGAHRPAPASRPQGLRARLAAVPFGWREAYFGEFCGTLLWARTLAERCASAAPRRRRRRLRALAWGGRARRLALLAPFALGKGGAETRRAARRLLRALAWPAMISNLARRRPAARRYFDASLPPAVRDALALAPKRPAGAAELDRRLRPLSLAASPAAPRRVNLLLPAIDPAGLFGGYIGIYNLARRLAESGQRPRLVPVGYDHAALPQDWRGRIESHGGLEGLFDRVEVGFARAGEPLEANPADAFLASSWWTAHVAHRALAELGEGGRFVYLIQDYEPSFYPAGSWAALAHESYELPHRALFSTELLREYFRRHRIGVYAASEEQGSRDSVSFQHAIAAVEPGPLTAEAAAGKRLLFYARSEEYAPRNLFDVAVLALADLVAEGAIDSTWTLTGVGTLTGAERIDLGGGVSMRVVSRQTEERYLDLLRGHDVGLSLMYSPHPSLVPLEMAAAGQIAVTNSFENKTRAALAAISENLIAAEPTLGGIESGLREAIAAAGDLERRRRGAAVAWSRDWDRSLDDATLAPVLAWLDER